MGQENNVTDQHQAPNLTAIKDRQQKTWTSGDYARIGNTLVIIGELLCEAVDVRAGERSSTSQPAVATLPSPPPAGSVRQPA